MILRCQCRILNPVPLRNIAVCRDSDIPRTRQQGITACNIRPYFSQIADACKNRGFYPRIGVDKVQ